MRADRALALLALAVAPLRAQDDAAPAWRAGYDDGFFVRSPDGRDELVLEGLFQAGLQVHQRDRGRVSEFELRRMRPELAGRFAGAWLFRVEPKFTEHEVELEEAWVGVDLAERSSRLMLGRMKAPFGLEEVRSRRHIDFPRFSILNQFAPAEDHGVFWNGSAGALEWGLAAYNGTGASDTESSKDVAARLGVRPFAGGTALENLHAGVAATWGRQDRDVGGASIDNAFDAPFLDFATGARLDGERTRAGAELAWSGGPWLLQSELLWVRQEMRAPSAALADVDFRAAYVAASCVLTGEERRGWSGVRPERPFDPVSVSGPGAWVLALRLSELRADRALERAGLTVPGRYSEQVRSVSLGLNWVPSRHAIVRHAWVHSFYSDDVLLGGAPRSHEGALMVEWQLHF